MEFELINENVLVFVRPVEYNIISKGVNIMGYVTANQAAKKWNISQRRVQILCAENRIEGVFKLGEAWAIPEDAEKPRDNRKARKHEE